MWIAAQIIWRSSWEIKSPFNLFAVYEKQLRHINEISLVIFLLLRCRRPRVTPAPALALRRRSVTGGSMHPVKPPTRRYIFSLTSASQCLNLNANLVNFNHSFSHLLLQAVDIYSVVQKCPCWTSGIFSPFNSGNHQTALGFWKRLHCILHVHIQYIWYNMIYWQPMRH